MTDRPIAYVMEQTLGSITHYLNLRKQEPMPDCGTRRWIPIEYREGRAPWTITGSLLARRALGPVLDDVGGIFIHTTTLSLLSADYFAKKPTVISSDGTPLNKRHMREGYNLRPEGRLSEQTKRFLFRNIFSRARGFVAWSSWTKQSFIEDYGCREEDVIVIPPGIDMTQFAPGDRDHDLPRILFVGGDFPRKGGDLLLKVFRARLRGKAELDLVTRGDLESEPGVRVHKNVQANSKTLLDLYATSDIFCVPTRADCYPLVFMEALAAGLPLVATRVGGIPDMVREGETGYLIDADDAEALGDRLEALAKDPELRRRMSTASREDAQKRFEVHSNAKALFEFVRSRC